MRSNLKSYGWIVLILLLAACSPSTKTATSTPLTNMNAFSTQANITADVTQTIASTLPPLLTETPTPKPKSTRRPTPTQLPLFIVKGLRIAYTFNKNVYIQDSGEQSIQLTSSEADDNAILSDDGHMVVFYRKFSEKPLPDMERIYAVNADGANKEQALITGELLASLNSGYTKSTEQENLVFVPGTHQLVFNTHQRIGPKGSDAGVIPNNDLLIVDGDSAKITQLLAYGKGGHFQVSPNGKLIAVQTIGHIDIINLQGQVLYRNLVTYPNDEDHAWMPIFWTQDSSQLIVLSPIPVEENPNNKDFPLLRTVWKYALDGRKPVETRLDPPPMAGNLNTSPDGNWIAYIYVYDSWKTEKDGKFGLYLGNLRDGTSKLLDPIILGEGTTYSLFAWNPNSSYFITAGKGNDYLSMQIWDDSGKGISVPKRGGLIGWLDNKRYLYDGGIMGELGFDTKFSVIQNPGGYFVEGAFQYLNIP